MSPAVHFAAPPDGTLDPAMCAAWARDGFLILDGYLTASDCDRLQARAVALAAAHDPAAARTVFSAADQRHARDRYFRDSAEAIGFFFEEQAGDRPAARALNKIGHALHDLDPVFAAVSYSPRLGALARALGLAAPQALQSMYIFKSAQIGGEVDWHQDATFLHSEPSTVTRFVRRGEGFEMQTLDPAPWPDTPPVALPAQRGTLIALHGLLPHASAANLSSRPRHAYSLHLIDGRAAYGRDNWLQRPTLGLRTLP
jgi:phytanoyl-CoA hydroxylase